MDEQTNETVEEVVEAPEALEALEAPIEAEIAPETVVEPEAE